MEKEFIVLVKEVWVQPVIVMAVDETEARQKVADGDGDCDEDGLELSHTLDQDTWTIKPAPKAPKIDWKSRYP